MAFNPHSPAMSPHTSSAQPSLSGKGKVIVWTDWMDQCSAKKNVTTTGLQCAEIYGVHEHYYF